MLLHQVMSNVEATGSCWTELNTILWVTLGAIQVRQTGTKFTLSKFVILPCT